MGFPGRVLAGCLRRGVQLIPLDEVGLWVHGSLERKGRSCLAGQVTKMPHCPELHGCSELLPSGGCALSTAPNFVGGLVGWAGAQLGERPLAGSEDFSRIRPRAFRTQGKEPEMNPADWPNGCATVLRADVFTVRSSAATTQRGRGAAIEFQDGIFRNGNLKGLPGPHRGDPRCTCPAEPAAPRHRGCEIAWTTLARP